MPTLTIDNYAVESCADARLLDAARAANAYIPTLCSHPDLPIGRGAKSVSLCLIEVDDALARAEAARCLQCDLRLTLSAPVLPPEAWLAFVTEKIAIAPEVDGVYQLLDADKRILKIAGARNLRRALEEQLASNSKARFLVFEEDRMYTQRESELLQHYLRQHGKLPEGNDELGDLF